MSEHVRQKLIPSAFRTKKAIRRAPSAVLRKIMGLCHVEPSDPDKCLACLAHVEELRRETVRRGESAPPNPRATGCDRPLVGSIKSEWFGYHLLVIPPDAPDVQVTETQRAFYAGATAMFRLINRASSPGRSEAEGSVILSELLAEVEAYRASLRDQT